jgi:hypothetical protein
MSTAHSFQTTTLPRLPALGSLLPQRLRVWLQARASPDGQHHTRESADMLYARAARYEATQSGFASDLRAAAEAMDRLAAQRTR